MDPDRRRARFEELAMEGEPQKKRLLALALIADRLAEDDIVPILVGGAALEFYTGGGYATSDVDLALPNTPEVDRAFADFGFEKRGRYWVRGDLDLLFEAPAKAGLPGEDAPRTVVTIEDLPVEIIGVEDLLIDRLRAAVHWESEEDQRWASRLAQLYADALDLDYLRARVTGDSREERCLEELLEGLSRFDP